MAYTYQEFHGGYNNTGNFFNVILGGAPGAVGFGGIPLGMAHSSNVGKGIGFDGDYSSLSVKLDLTGYATDDIGSAVLDTRYVHYGGAYDWFIDIQYSTDSQGSWQTLLPHTKIFSHDASQDWELSYRGSWLRTAQNSQYEKTGLSIPTNTTHVRVSLTGDNPTQSTWVVYPINKVIQNYKPMAIRKSGTWKTLNVPSGFIKRRVSSTWKDDSTENLGTKGAVNSGHNRIRKSSRWLQQGPLGNK